MGENDNPNAGAPQPGQSSQGKDGSTSQATKTYTEAEKSKAVSDALADAGRKHKLELEPVVRERDSYKKEVTTIKQGLDALSQERDDLKITIDELSKEDPERFNLLEKDRDLKNRERKLKDELAGLETERTDWKERLTKVETFERNENIRNVAADYEGITEEKLKVLCDRLKLTTLEQIQAAAETLGTKKAVKVEDETSNTNLHVDSGVTRGGGGDRIGDLPPKEWEAALKKKVKS